MDDDDDDDDGSIMFEEWVRTGQFGGFERGWLLSMLSKDIVYPSVGFVDEMQSSRTLEIKPFPPCEYKVKSLNLSQRNKKCC